MPRCKACISAEKKQQYWADPKRFAQYNRRTRAKRAEKEREYSAKYYADNRDRLRAKRRENYRKKSAEYQARTDARRRNLEPPTEETREYWKILRQDPCVYCGAPSEHTDHIKPVHLGGSNQWENLAATCAECNQSKRLSSPLEFMLRRLSVA